MFLEPPKLTVAQTEVKMTQLNLTLNTDKFYPLTYFSLQHFQVC